MSAKKPKFVLGRGSKEKLAGCRALLYTLAERSLARADMPYDWKVTHGYRSGEEQNALYAIGRRGVPGEKIVTKARAGQSKHNAWPAEAFDLAIIEGKGVSWENAKYEAVSKVIFAEWKLMQAEGLTREVVDGKPVEWELVWGRRWGDDPHWEIRRTTVK
jgi:hypothetical protein